MSVRDFTDVSNFLLAWIQAVWKERKLKSADKDANTLMAATDVVLAIRKFYHQFHGLMNECQSLSPSWSDDRRKILREKIEEFATQRILLNAIVTSLALLEHAVKNFKSDEGKAALKELINHCQEIEAVAETGSTATPWLGYRMLNDFLEELVNVQTKEDAEEVHNKSAAWSDSFNTDVLKKINEQYGTLRGDILQRNPLLRDSFMELSEKLKQIDQIYDPSRRYD